MKRGIFVFTILLAFTSMIKANNNANDTIKSSVKLNEVEVTAKNITRVDDYLLILPTKQQIKFANSGYDVLTNLMLPGVSVDAQSGAVSAMGMSATLFINGIPCDYRDMRMLRPKDIEKIEYFDAPKGKYSNCQIAINFVVRRYDFGGYVQVDGTQTIGFSRGNYNIAATLNKKRTTYSLFAGAGYSGIEGSNSKSVEMYNISHQTYLRSSETAKSQGNNNQYAQLRVQHASEKGYFIGKFTLNHNSMPENSDVGMVNNNGDIYSFRSSSDNRSLSPRIDINGMVSIDKRQNIDFGIHGTYSRNKYNRYYTEADYAATTNQEENVWSVNGGVIYTRNNDRSIITVQLMQFFDIYDAHYLSNTDLWQHLWKSETLGFLNYNYNPSKTLQLRARVGFDWYQFRLHGNDKFSSVNPRINLNTYYRLKNGMLQWSFMLANSGYGMNVINNAVVDINPFMQAKGNPNIKKSYDIDTYVYFSKVLKKFTITAMTQFQYNINPITYNYYEDNGKIMRSFINDGNNNHLSIIGGVSYNHSNNLSVNADIRYSNTNVNSTLHFNSDDITGNISLQWRVKNVMIAPTVNFATTIINRNAMTKNETPINYMLRTVYSYKNLYASVSIVSPFTKRHIHSELITPVYCSGGDVFNRSMSKYCNVALSYTFDFGRRTNKIKKEIETQSSSSLLRAE